MKFKIKSKKITGKFIYGDITKNKGAASLAIFMSGFDGSADFPLFKNASSMFLKNDIDSLRLHFCEGKKDAPMLQDENFSMYTTELKNIVDTFGKSYSTIVLVGHSFGAIIAILFLNKYKKYAKKTKLVLWEPTLLPWKTKWMEEDFTFNADKKFYYGKHRKEILNETFYKECIDIENTTDTLRMLNKSVLIIAAKGSADKDARKYFQRTRDKKVSELFLIDKTDHYFKGRSVQKELFEKTIQFLATK